MLQAGRIQILADYSDHPGGVTNPLLRLFVENIEQTLNTGRQTL